MSDANVGSPVAESAAVALSEVKLLERRIARDARGSFSELWREAHARAAGLPAFVQDNLAHSTHGVVRGLHFQHPDDQAKLVTVALGEVFDVAVDIRVGSPTFGRWVAYTLSEANGRHLFIPAGFAHGYQTVSTTSVVIYKCSDYYAPESERTIRWDDPRLGISWPIAEVVVSPRDAGAPLLHEVPAASLPRLRP